MEKTLKKNIYIYTHKYICIKLNRFAETNTTLQINYTSIKKLKLKKSRDLSQT